MWSNFRIVQTIKVVTRKHTRAMDCHLPPLTHFSGTTFLTSPVLLRQTSLDGKEKMVSHLLEADFINETQNRTPFSHL